MYASTLREKWNFGQVNATRYALFIEGHPKPEYATYPQGTLWANARNPYSART